jgi:phosphoglycerol transferase MdoB-like AlkP superfamily enzyme
MSELPRTALSVGTCLVGLVILSGFRCWLYRERRSDVSSLDIGQKLKLFWIGVRLDGVIVSRVCMPLVVAALVLPDALLLASRIFFGLYLGIVYFTLFFAEIAGIYFFRFYDFRPNYLVFEHGADREVLKTVAKAYPLVRIVLLSFAGACLTVKVVQLLTPMAQVSPVISDGLWGWDRGGTFLWLLLTAFASRGTLDHRPLNPSLSSFTTNRIANEIACCGIFNLLYEWSQRAKNEFAALKSITQVPSTDEAFAGARQMLSSEGSFSNDGPNPLTRRITNPCPRAALNVVLVVMESFTGRLTGCLGGSPAISPQLDELAADGLLLERCYATGERTIQGLEAAVCSFPPLPGEGVVKRPQARQNFATLASVLKQRGYATTFLYGGQGIFDHMLGFFLGNGFEHFIEEKDFPAPRYKSPWGVSDEDLFERGDAEFRRYHEAGQPFFATLLTVSLHSPWQFPAGKIEPLAADTKVPAGFELDELSNFLYADYCIGKFIRMARQAPYFDNTLFVFVGDHGVHLRGNQLIPVDEYIVPALFLAPQHVGAGRISTVASQMDLPPTIMGIVGGEYRSAFFGRDVRKPSADDPFAMVIYNKKRYGIVTDRELIVLRESGDRLAYQRAGVGSSWLQVKMTEIQTSRAQTGLAILRSAESLLVSGRYHSEPHPALKL